MALPSSPNPISFSQLRSEYGGGNGSISMGQLYRRTNQQSGNPYHVQNTKSYAGQLVLLGGSAYSSSVGSNKDFARSHFFFTSTPQASTTRVYEIVWDGITKTTSTYTGNPNANFSFSAGGNDVYQPYPVYTGHTFSASNIGYPPSREGTASGINASAFDFDTGFWYGNTSVPTRINWVELCITRWVDATTTYTNQTVPIDTTASIKMSQFRGKGNAGNKPPWAYTYKYISNSNGQAYNY